MLEKILNEDDKKLLYLFFDNLKISSQRLLNPELLEVIERLTEDELEIVKNGGSVLEEDLIKKLESAKTNYSKEVEEETLKNQERGALRALTWGKKAAGSQISLVKRVESKEEILDDKKIYVCDACGFLMINTKAPERCPVCKAPSDKFIAY
ncbi:MAG: rubredoxin-like domain-containing protein [Fusobacteriota bacterium]